MPRLSKLVAPVLLAALVAGFFGDVAPPLDSLAHFRAHLAAALVLWALALLFRRAFFMAGLSAAAGLIALVLVAPYLLPLRAEPSPQANADGAGRSYTLLQMNLMWNASDRQQAIDLIRRVSPDIITLDEATVEWRRPLAALRDAYPFRFACPGPFGATDAVILSKHPFAAASQGVCGDRRLAVRGVDLNGKTLMVVAQHLRWPWPGGQWNELASDRDVFAAIRRAGVPVLVAGDFNAAPWSAAVEAYAGRTGTRIERPIGPTWLFRPLTPLLAAWIGLPIDNVLASPKGIDIEKIERLPATSSDHLPVLVTFSLPPPGADRNRTLATGTPRG